MLVSISGFSIDDAVDSSPPEFATGGTVMAGLGQDNASHMMNIIRRLIRIPRWQIGYYRWISCPVDGQHPK